VEVTIPLPAGVEYVSAAMQVVDSGQSIPCEVTTVNGNLIIQAGDVDVGQQVNIDLLLSCLTSGTKGIQASARSAETTEPVNAQEDVEVDVEDVYHKVITTTSPIHMCGCAGLAPLMLMLVGLTAMRCTRLRISNW
jgi:hypothetical protein